jgi:hypothetical protein
MADETTASRSPRAARPTRARPAPTRSAPNPAAEPISRALGRVLWEHEFKTKNPTATAEERKANWTSTRGDYAKAGRQLHLGLKRRGFKIEAPADAGDAEG